MVINRKSTVKKPIVASSKLTDFYRIPIPNHFIDLFDAFSLLDIEVNKLLKKRESIYVDRICEVFRDNEKFLDESIIGQIIAVLPDAYSFEYDKTPVKITRHYRERIRLIPNISFGLPDENVNTKPGKCFTVKQLVKRKNCFYECLLKIVQKKHNEFLANISAINDSNNYNENLMNKFIWHKDFDLENFVEKIEPKPLTKNVSVINNAQKRNSDINSDKMSPKLSAVSNRKLSSEQSSAKMTINSVKTCPKPTDLSRTSIAKSPHNSCEKPSKISSQTSPDRKDTAVTSKPDNKTSQSLTKSPLNKVLIKAQESIISCEKPPKMSSRISADRKDDNITPKPDNKTRQSLIKSPLDKVSVKSPIPSSVTPESNKFQSKLVNNTRKSPITSIKITPARDLSGNKSNNVTPKCMNQSRLSFSVVDSNKKVVSPANKSGIDLANTVDDPNADFHLKHRLPSHLKAITDIFIKLEKAIRDTHCKGEVSYLSKISPTVSVRSNFSETHLGKIITIYPDAYSIKWEQIAKPLARAPSKKYDISIKPNLKNDGTRSAQQTADGGIVKFDFVRLKERQKMFLEKCWEIVVSSYQDFLIEKCSIPPEHINEHLNKKQWNPEFNIDLHVKSIQPTAMPCRPEEKEDQKELKKISQIFAIAKQRNTPEIKRKSSEFSPAIVNDKYKSISQSLLDKVKQNREKKSIFTREEPSKDKRRLMIAKLPDTAKIIYNEFKKEQHKPLNRNNVKKIICQSVLIEEDAFDEYINLLMELIPGWIKVLQWSTPHFSIENSQLSFSEVNRKLDTIITSQRV